MRLFQEHVQVDNFDPPPSIYRDRVDIKQIPLLKQFRQSTKRLPTPDKDAIIELSNSFEKKRLGKQQRILADIAQRCREQEIGDLSEKLSSKCNILTFQDTKDASGYPNTLHKQQGRKSNVSPERGANSPTTNLSGESSGPKFTFERSYKHFPIRRIIKHHSKLDLGKTTLPKIKVTLQKGYFSDLNMKKSTSPQRMNGTIQSDHYASPRPDLPGPMNLPQLQPAQEMDRFDPSFSTSRLSIGQRSSSHVLLGGNTFGGRTYQASRTVNRYNTFNDMSPLEHLLGAVGEPYLPDNDPGEPEKGPRPTPTAVKT